VVWNLVSNALKFTPRNGAVRVSLREQADDVEVEVADTGIGISAEFLPFVFDRFRQADSSMSRRHNGLGLGMAIVRHLVELQGHSERRGVGLGRGATFTRDAAEDRGARAPAPAARENAGEPASEQAKPVSLRDLRVWSWMTMPTAGLARWFSSSGGRVRASPSPAAAMAMLELARRRAGDGSRMPGETA
jgi:anti-sigma regulatory factor (Ser/Thr protein kinase)